MANIVDDSCYLLLFFLFHFLNIDDFHANLYMVLYQVLELDVDWIDFYSGWSIRMESRADFVQCLGSDMSINILACLNEPVDVVRAGSVSRLWHHFGELRKLKCDESYSWQ